MFEQTKKTVLGGYSCIAAIVLIHAVGLYGKKLIKFRDFRAVFALLYMASIRFAASCSGGSTQAKYTVHELAKLLGTKKDSYARSAIAALKKSGILTEFSESEITFNLTLLASVEDTLELANRTAKGTYRNALRKIPVPRNALLFIAKTDRYASATALVMSFVRCLSIDRKGNIKAKGAVKNSWIAKGCNIGLSTAERIRQDWIAWGWLKRDTESSRRKQNRTGAYCEFNLDRIGKITPTSATSMRVPNPQNDTSMRVPYKDINLPTELKNQNLTASPSYTGNQQKQSGVCKQTLPTFINVVPEDLESLDRLEVLFSDAMQRKLVANTSIARLNFVAAAVRARQVAAAGKGRDAVRIFTGIVRRGLYHVISQAQEEKARTWINRARGAINEFAESPTKQPQKPPYQIPVVRQAIMPQREKAPSHSSLLRFQKRQFLKPCRRSQHTENDPQRRSPCGLFKTFLAARQRLKEMPAEQRGTFSVEHW